jgi:hypothetical protein
MAALLASLPAHLPLKGVLHAAGTTEPVLLVNTTDDIVRGLYRPKVTGTWVLHELTRPLDLDFFVGFSSAAATWGAALLGAYGAANHFIDLVAHHRRALGLPGLSVNWGGWSGGGMANADVQRYAAQMGLGMAPAAQFLEALDLFLQQGLTQVNIGPIDWRIFKAVLEARGERPLLEHIEVLGDLGSGAGAWAEELQRVPPEARWERLVSHVQERAAAVVGFSDPLALDPHQGFFQIGMDSVMSVRLRNELERSVGRSLPPTLAFEQPTVVALATWLAREVLDVEPPAPHQTPPQPAAPEPADTLGDLSEDELEALLASELGGPAGG